MRKACWVVGTIVVLVLLGTITMICGAALASPIANIQSVAIRILVGIGLTLAIITAILFASRIMCILAEKLRRM